jgi:hypothetical protein
MNLVRSDLGRTLALDVPRTGFCAEQYGRGRTDAVRF